MLYQEYRKRMMKWSEVIKKLRYFAVPILAAFVLLLATLFTLLGINGNIYGDTFTETTKEVVYGEPLSYSAKAVMRKAVYEYKSATKSDAVWQEGYPVDADTYQVRAKAKRTFGGVGYGKVHTLVVQPKDSVVTYATDKITYGEEFALKADLVYGDRLVKFDFTYGDGKDETPFTVILKEDSLCVEDTTGREVTANYSFRFDTEGVEMKQRKLTLSTPSLQKVYDGQPLEGSDVEITSGSLAEGDELIPLSHAKLTDFLGGEIVNEAKYQIKNQEGKDVTCRYDIKENFGTLSLAKRKATLTSGSASFVYDGAPHSEESYTFMLTPFTQVDHVAIEEYALVAGDKLFVENYATITTVGRMENRCEYRLCDKEGKDISSLYDVTTVYGTLEVTPMKLVVETGSKTWEYSGDTFTLETYTFSEGFIPKGQMVTILSNTEICTVGEKENVLSLTVTDEDYRSTMKNYEIEYVYGTLVVEKRKITVTTGSEEWIFDNSTYFCDDCEVENLSYRHRYSLTKHVFVKYVADSCENKLAVTVFDPLTMEDVSENYEIAYVYGYVAILPRSVSLITHSNEWIYDGAPHFDNLAEASEESLAMPEDCVASWENYVTLVNAGRKENAVAKDEIYITDKYNKVITENFAVTIGKFGTLIVLPRPIAVATGSGEWIYDGEGHSNDSVTLASDSPYSLVRGHYFSVNSYPTVQNAGSVENEIDFTILSADGVDQTANYEIERMNGTLTILPRPIAVETGSGEWVYDGEVHSNDSVIIASKSPYPLAHGQTFEVIKATTIQQVGVKKNEISFVIRSEDGGDQTKNYDISITCGTLVVKQVVVEPEKKTYIVVQTSDVEKTYDGEPLYDYGVWCDQMEYWGMTTSYLPDGGARVTGKLKDGNEIRFQFDRGFVGPGVRENSVTIDIYDKKSINVTEQYEIERRFGNLTVYENVLRVKPVDVYSQYTTQTVSAISNVEDANIAPGEVGALQRLLWQGYSYSVVVTGSQTGPGVSESEIIQFRLYDWSGKNVTDRYQIEFFPGKIEVDRQPIDVYVYRSTKYYDGKPLSFYQEDFEVKTSGFTLDCSRLIAATAIEKAGVVTIDELNEKYVSFVDVYYNGENVSDRYRVSFSGEYALLHVYATKLTFTAGSSSKKYDGEELRDERYRISFGSLAEGDTVENIEVIGSITKVGETENYVDKKSIRICNAKGEDVTNCYDITTVAGKLSVVE